MEAPGGRWRDVLRGDERSFSAAEPIDRVLAGGGVGVYEKLAVG